MTRACICTSVTLGNTGETNCNPLAKVIKKFIMVPTYDSTGAANKHLITTLITPAVLTAKINNSDTTVRWYPSPFIESIGGERPDPVMDTAPSGRKVFVKEGIRTMTGEFYEVGPEYLYQLQNQRCVDWSVYGVDAEGSLIGMQPVTADGYLYPIKIAKGSWFAKWIPATDSTASKISFAFDWSQTEQDEFLRMITAGDMTADLLNAEGLLDIGVEYGAISTTTVKVSLVERYGSQYKKNKLKGMVVADFVSSVTGATSKLRNQTDSADITISTAVEETGTETSTSGPGTYLLTFTPAQTSADVMILKLSKTGFDFSDAVANTFAIP
jgi:hypothetical protein